MDYFFPLNTFTVVASGAAVVATTFFRNIFNQQRGIGKNMYVAPPRWRWGRRRGGMEDPELTARPRCDLTES